MNNKNKNIRNMTRYLSTLLCSVILIILSSCGTRKSLQDYFNVPKAKPFNVSKVIVTTHSCAGQQTVSISGAEFSWKQVISYPAVLLFEIVLETDKDVAAVSFPTSERYVSDTIPLFIKYRKIKLLA